MNFIAYNMNIINLENSTTKKILQYLIPTTNMPEDRFAQKAALQVLRRIENLGIRELSITRDLGKRLSKKFLNAQIS